MSLRCLNRFFGLSVIGLGLAMPCAFGQEPTKHADGDPTELPAGPKPETKQREEDPAGGVNAEKISKVSETLEELYKAETPTEALKLLNEKNDLLTDAASAAPEGLRKKLDAFGSEDGKLDTARLVEGFSQLKETLGDEDLKTLLDEKRGLSDKEGAKLGELEKKIESARQKLIAEVTQGSQSLTTEELNKKRSGLQALKVAGESVKASQKTYAEQRKAVETLKNGIGSVADYSMGFYKSLSRSDSKNPSAEKVASEPAARPNPEGFDRVIKSTAVNQLSGKNVTGIGGSPLPKDVTDVLKSGGTVSYIVDETTGARVFYSDKTYLASTPIDAGGKMTAGAAAAPTQKEIQAVLTENHLFDPMNAESGVIAECKGETCDPVLNGKAPLTTKGFETADGAQRTQFLGIIRERSADAASQLEKLYQRPPSLPSFSRVAPQPAPVSQTSRSGSTVQNFSSQSSAPPGMFWCPNCNGGRGGWLPYNR